jgi:hypothetical protein
LHDGWDRMMFRGGQNFGGMIPTGGLSKPTAMLAGYYHPGCQLCAFETNETSKDFTCDFEKDRPPQAEARNA